MSKGGRRGFASSSPFASSGNSGGQFKSKVSLILIGVLFFGVIGFLAFSNLKMYQKRAELRDKTEELKKDIQILSERNEQLRAGIFDAESDVYWEEVVRKYGYVGEGEEAIVVIPPEEKEEVIVSEEKAFLESLLDWILMR